MPTQTTVPLLAIEPLPYYEPTIGRWLWLLEDTRRETDQAIADLAPGALDWVPGSGENSIGTLLYHIALIELDWIATEVLQQRSLPEKLTRLFPAADRDAHGQLSRVAQTTLQEHIDRLTAVREYLFAAFRGMTLEEFRRPHTFPTYRVTAEWVLHHLIQHEVEHRGQIQLLRTLAGQALGPQ